MKVIILSSGKGTRMMPLTKDTPKPMLEINGENLLENKINLCRKSGLSEIIINVAYKKNLIINYIKTLDIDIHLVDEGDEPLGTAEGIRNIIKNFDDFDEMQDWITDEVQHRIDYTVQHSPFTVSEEEYKEIEEYEYSLIKIEEV